MKTTFGHIKNCYNLEDIQIKTFEGLQSMLSIAIGLIYASLSHLHLMIRLYLFMLILLAFSTGIGAQESKFPVFANQAISRPAGLPQFKAEDFKIYLSRIDLYPDGFLYGDQETLRKLGDFFINDPEGHKIWKDHTIGAAKILNQWDFIRMGFGADRYIYNIFQLENLSLIYLFTGHQELGRFIYEHMMQIASLPLEFWLHSELRNYSGISSLRGDPEHPLGVIETSCLCRTISITLSGTSELFSLAEKNKIEKALYDKGLLPCLNWLDQPSENNYTPVISTGAYVTSKYLNDCEGMSKAFKAMTRFLNGSIEKDGSYGEGTGYFGYAIRSLLPAILVMKYDEREKAFSNSGLRHSATWKMYPYLFTAEPDKQIQPTMLNFCDTQSSGPTGPSTNIMLSLLYRDSLSSWLTEKVRDPFYEYTDYGNWFPLVKILERLLIYSYPKGLPEPKSPEQAGLPLLKVFDNGDCFMRSSWDVNSIVLAMRSGDGSLVKFSHQRPELLSIALGGYGEYMIVSPGSASYRSPLRSTWDQATRSANTITVDDKNQLFPAKANSYNSDFWMPGRPKAEIVECKAGKLADILVNEGAQAYHVPMKNVRRSVLFIRDPGYFVMVDKIEAVNSQHKYTWRIHLNNKDDLGKIRNIGPSHWHFSRPLAELDIYLFADQKLETNIGQGYMHGPRRDYSPGGIYEGKLGSSIELEAYNPEKSKSLTCYSVLYPSKNGTSAPIVEFTGDKIVVGKDTLAFSDGECTIGRNGIIESFNLW